MRRFNIHPWIKLGALGGLLVLLLADAAFAAEGEQSFRPVYDVVMRWINFAILAFLLYKFGRKPLMGFLQGQRSEIEKEIGKVEIEKDQILAKVKEAADALEESKVRLPELKARLIEKGERQKQELIQEAKDQSVLIMEGARHKIEYQILRARQKLILELLDMAVEEAFKKLPQIITAEDDQRQVEKYLAIAGK